MNLGPIVSHYSKTLTRFFCVGALLANAAWAEPKTTPVPAPAVSQPAAANSQPTTANNQPVTLEAILRQTSSNNGQIKEALSDVDIARAQLEQARAALWPHGNIVMIAAPIFEEKGALASNKK